MKIETYDYGIIVSTQCELLDSTLDYLLRCGYTVAVQSNEKLISQEVIGILREYTRLGVDYFEYPSDDYNRFKRHLGRHCAEPIIDLIEYEKNNIRDYSL